MSLNRAEFFGRAVAGGFPVSAAARLGGGRGHILAGQIAVCAAQMVRGGGRPGVSAELPPASLSFLADGGCPGQRPYSYRREASPARRQSVALFDVCVGVPCIEGFRLDRVADRILGGRAACTEPTQANDSSPE